MGRHNTRQSNPTAVPHPAPALQGRNVIAWGEAPGDTPTQYFLFALYGRHNPHSNRDRFVNNPHTNHVLPFNSTQTIALTGLEKSVRWPTTRASARAGVLGTRRSYRGEKSPTEAVMPTVVVGQSGTREGTDERAEDKRTTAGTRTGSEAAGVGELASNGKTRRSS